MNINSKRQQEKELIALMIDLYSKKHVDEVQMCHELKEYAFTKIDRCPFMETKTFCSSCKVHCYQSEQRQNIKKIMRFSGPRMLFYHPVIAIRHMMSERRKK